MPFALYALYTFSRLMNLTLPNMFNEFVTTYLDNVLVYSETQQVDLMHLRNIFERI